MINYLTPDVICAICGYLDVGDIRALIIVSRDVRNYILPFTKVRTTSTILNLMYDFRVVQTIKSMYKFGIIISNDIRMANADIQMTPPVVPMDYTGMVSVLFNMRNYNMILRDGYLHKWLTCDSRCISISNVQTVGLCTHFTDAINSIYAYTRAIR